MEFKDKVVYQIYPKSFCDANGDGWGDLRGITEKLDYLADLGVDYLWLTPFMVSPQKDNGYDVADYCAIDARFGTMADFTELVHEAKKRHIGLMLDMVFNHTSTEHRWFQRALAGDEKYQAYYVFRDGTPDKPPFDCTSVFGGPAWEYVPQLGKWYLHCFERSQADLDWENPDVREELKEVIRFWRDKGVAGFRFDVINLISKPQARTARGTVDLKSFMDGPRVHEYIKELTRDTGLADLLTVGEMSGTTIPACVRYADPAEKELSMCFHFHHLKVDYAPGNKWQRQPADIGALKKILQAWQLAMQEHGSWDAVFWCNHDQPRVVSRFGDEGRYWRTSAKMLGLAIHFLRGTPYIYQGEELGMMNAGFTAIEQYNDVESRNAYAAMRQQGLSDRAALAALAFRSRDNSRTPMQWEDGPHDGFSLVDPWLAMGRHQEITAAAEQKDRQSVFHWYQQLIRLRKQKKAIASGRIRFLYADVPDLLAYQRSDEETAAQITVLCNFSAQPLRVPDDWTGWQLLLDSASEPLKETCPLVLRPFEGIALEK